MTVDHLTPLKVPELVHAGAGGEAIPKRHSGKWTIDPISASA